MTETVAPDRPRLVTNADLSGPAEKDAHESGTATRMRRWFNRRPSPDQTRLDAEVGGLFCMIEALLEKTRLEEVQIELGRIANLLPYLQKNGDVQRLQYLKLALLAMDDGNPNLEFAKSLRREAEYNIQRTQRGLFRFVYVIAGTTPLGSLLAGVVCTVAAMIVVLYVSLTLAYLLAPEVTLEIPGGAPAVERLENEIAEGVYRDFDLMVPVILLAALGSLVSLFVRLDQFANVRVNDPFLTFCTGFFKPYIGIGFALFVFAVFKSGVIAVGGTRLDEIDPYTYWALGFLCGFSERFASDFVARAENQLAVAPAPPPPAAKGQPKS
jgi:hypothetical protein